MRSHRRNGEVGPMTDAVAILEAAYSLEGGEHGWLVRLGETVRHNVDNCRGVRAQTYDVSSDALAIRETADCGLDEGMATAMLAKVALPASDHNVLAPMLRRRFVGSLRAAPAALVRSGLDAERVRQFEGNLNQFLHQWNQSDQWWVNAQDPTGLGCLIIAPRGSGERFGPRIDPPLALHRRALGLRLSRPSPVRCRAPKRPPRPGACSRGRAPPRRYLGARRTVGSRRRSARLSAVGGIGARPRARPTASARSRGGRPDSGRRSWPVAGRFWITLTPMAAVSSWHIATTRASRTHAA